MIVSLNGKAHKIPDGSTLPDLLGILGFESPKGIAMAVDGNVVPRTSWSGYGLKSGMRIEVLKAVQGG